MTLTYINLYNFCTVRVPERVCVCEREYASRTTESISKCEMRKWINEIHTHTHTANNEQREERKKKPRAEEEEEEGGTQNDIEINSRTKMNAKKKICEKRTHGTRCEWMKCVSSSEFNWNAHARRHTHTHAYTHVYAFIRKWQREGHARARACAHSLSRSQQCAKKKK